MGFCLYGNDIDDTTSPIEAGLGWITKLAKGEFNGSDLIVAEKESGSSRKLVAFTLSDRRVPRHDYLIEDAAGNVIGKVTSGTQSPSLDIPIGMGYVATPFAKLGTEIFIATGGKKMPAVVTKLPFYKA
jgi:aminomethyltransferase